MMKMTSATAAKELRKLDDQLEALQARERKSAEFVAAIQEDVEQIRPEYDFAACQKEQVEIQGKIRTLKHAINCFNLKQVVPGFEMTIDQMLVYIPQLSARKRRLDYMRSVLPRERMPSGHGMNIIEYKYANYDVAAAELEYNKAVEELAKAQNALDLVNSTVEFEV